MAFQIGAGQPKNDARHTIVSRIKNFVKNNETFCPIGVYLTDINFLSKTIVAVVKDM